MYYIDSLHRVKYFMPSFLEIYEKSDDRYVTALVRERQNSNKQLSAFFVTFLGGMVSFCV